VVPARRKNKKYTLPITRESEGDPDLHRVPAAIRRRDPRHHPAIRGAGCTVPDTGMDRHRGLRLHGPAHAPLVRQAVGQAPLQPLLRGAAVGGGFGVADGASGLSRFLFMALSTSMDRAPRL